MNSSTTNTGHRDVTQGSESLKFKPRSLSPSPLPSSLHQTTMSIALCIWPIFKTFVYIKYSNSLKIKHNFTFRVEMPSRYAFILHTLLADVTTTLYTLLYIGDHKKQITARTLPDLKFCDFIFIMMIPTQLFWNGSQIIIKHSKEGGKMVNILNDYLNDTLKSINHLQLCSLYNIVFPSQKK